MRRTHHTKTKKPLHWLKIFGYERIATGIFFLWATGGTAYFSSSVIGGTTGGGFQLSSFAQGVLSVSGLILIASGIGLIKEKAWARVAVMVEIAIAGAFGIVAITLIVLSWPEGWGRWALVFFILFIIVLYVALVSLFVSLLRMHGWARRGEWHGHGEKGGATMALALAGFVIVRLVAWQSLGIEVGGDADSQSLPHQEGATLQEAVQYCDTLSGQPQSQCYVQVAVAAASSGDALPQDFCQAVGNNEPQLKFLCIAYARQPESCATFGTIREQALCQGLVSGDASACDAINTIEDQAQCVTTVEGYIDAYQKELEATQPSQ